MDNLRKGTIINVGIVVVGGGPAALGFLLNAIKNNRIEKLV